MIPYPGSSGLRVSGPKGGIIGGTNATDRNIIMSTGAAVVLAGETRQFMILGNYIGVAADGITRLNPLTGEGVNLMGVMSNTVGGAGAGEGNVIAGFRTGLTVHGASAMHNRVYGNLIGLAADGMTALSNSQYGILLAGCRHNDIGHTGAFRNVIAASNVGLLLESGAQSNTVSGNWIGLATDGVSVRPMSLYSVLIRSGANGNQIAGKNVLAASGFDGISIQDGISSNNVITGNMIGTDPSGLIPLGNAAAGLYLSAPGTRVGGTSVADRNVISGNGGSGITIGPLGERSKIIGNYIGVDATGTNALGNGMSGIMISASHNNDIGGMDAKQRNVISGNGDHGIEVVGVSTNNRILHNAIGLSYSFSTPIGNAGDGMHFRVGGNGGSRGNMVGELAAPNYIGANTGHGIYMDSETNTTIHGNFIGHNGSVVYGNGSNGVLLVRGSSIHMLGNHIGGNHQHGVYAANVPLCELSNNLIGLGANNAVFSNASHGVYLQNAHNTLVAGNVISGNGGNGLFAFGSDHVVVQGNRIGVNTNGMAAIGNRENGIFLWHCRSNILGGVAGTTGNVVSGNEGSGIDILGQNSSHGYHVIKGNIIGLRRTGSGSVPNGSVGVGITESSSNEIGGAGAGEGNIIAANNSHGVIIAGSFSHHNHLAGNLIGVTMGGMAAGNNGTGIVMRLSATNNLIGGSSSAERNIIAYNAGAGVAIGAHGTDPAIHNQVTYNYIYANAGLGIDLGADGVTLNDPLDSDTGPNQRQNYPVITVASNSGTQMHVEGTLESVPLSTYWLEFYGSSELDASGYGEGEFFVGGDYLTLPVSGVASFTNTYVAPATVPNFLTATATRIDGLNSETSEFSYRFLMDADGDGMPDGYENIYFGSLTGGDPDGDLDLDGVSNLHEFLAGTEPDEDASFPQVIGLEMIGGVFHMAAQPNVETRQYQLLSMPSLLPGPHLWSLVSSDLVRDGKGFILSTPVSGVSTTAFFGISASLP